MKKRNSEGITGEEKVDSFRGGKDNFRGLNKCKREGDIARSSRLFLASRETRKVLKVLRRKESRLLPNE